MGHSVVVYGLSSGERCVEIQAFCWGGHHH